jgi:hypothetical protein
MASRIVIAIALITLVAGYGFNHKPERCAHSVNLQEVFR